MIATQAKSKTKQNKTKKKTRFLIELMTPLRKYSV